MAYLKPVLPQVVGQPRSARRDARAIFVPNAWGNVSEGIQGLNRGGLALGGALVDLAQERDDLDYIRTKNAAEAEANQRIHSEVLSKGGFGAEGSFERTQTILREVNDKYRPKLSGRNQRRFEETFGSYSNSRMSQAMGWEQKELDKANNEALTTSIDMSLGDFAANLDPRDLARAQESYDELFRRQNGGSLVTPAMAERIRADFTDGDNEVEMPNGRKMRIVDDGVEVKEGEIPRSQIPEILSQLERQSAVYQQGWQQHLDKAYSAVVTQQLKARDVAGARALVDALRDADAAQKPSEGALKIMTDAVDRAQEVVDISVGAQKSFADLRAVVAKEFSGEATYGGPAMDAAVERTKREIRQGYATDPVLRDRMLSALDAEYDAFKQQAAVQLQTDYTAHMIDWNNHSYSTEQRIHETMQMEDSPLKTALLKRLSKVRDFEHRALAAAGKSQDDLLKLEAESNASLDEIAAALADGFGATPEGVEFDMSGQDWQQKAVAFASSFPLTKEGKKKAAGLIHLAGKMVPTAIIRNEVARQTDNLKDPDALERVMKQYPGIITAVNMRKGTQPLEGVELNDFVRKEVAAFLRQEVWRDDLVFDDVKSRRDAADSGDSLYMTSVQVDAQISRERNVPFYRVTDEMRREYIKDNNLTLRDGKYYLREVE